jgi:hypothetical protein
MTSIAAVHLYQYQTFSIVIHVIATVVSINGCESKYKVPLILHAAAAAFDFGALADYLRTCSFYFSAQSSWSMKPVIACLDIQYAANHKGMLCLCALLLRRQRSSSFVSCLLLEERGSRRL